MTGTMKMSLAVAVLLAAATSAWAQEASTEAPAVPANVAEQAEPTQESARATVDAVAAAVDRNEQAQQALTGLLQPIYELAEAFSFPAFHWVAFAVMVAGVISFALQLTLGKLVVLARMGFSLGEILSDALGLVVSLVGIVLTTQAAAQNSTFTTSATAVLSATAVGALAGFVFYLWGQRLELEAVEGRKRVAEKRLRRKQQKAA